MCAGELPRQGSSHEQQQQQPCTASAGAAQAACGDGTRGGPALPASPYARSPTLGGPYKQ